MSYTTTSNTPLFEPPNRDALQKMYRLQGSKDFSTLLLIDEKE
jgi:hypothetical protein